LVTIPFGINILSRNSLRYGNPGVSGSRVGVGVADSSGISTDENDNEELRFILYFSIVFGIIEIIIIYAKYDFLNVKIRSYS
jgi:hypothetical protein